MTKQRTYWHLENLGRVPSDYDITSSRLFYHCERGFSVETPVASCYQRQQEQSRLRVADWHAFRDPLETTYARYVSRQAERESFTHGLFRSIEGTDHDRHLPTAWRELLEASLPVLRFPCHGMQMIAAGFAQFAPTARITMLGLFQSADEMRRIQKLAYRMRQLMDSIPGFGSDSKRAWVEQRAWQPLRKVVERLLVTYDFAEAFVGLNLVLKPAFDHVFIHGIGRQSDAHADALLGKLLFSLSEDAAWHRAWSQKLVEYIHDSDPANASVIRAWVDAWRGPVVDALSALADLEGSHGKLAEPVSEALEALEATTRVDEKMTQGVA